MIPDLWNSYRRLPLWVQAWVALWLFPLNLLALAFLDQPGGIAVAVLAVGGMVPNLGIMLWDRGFSKLMSLPHVILWSPLIPVLLWLLWQGEGSGAYRAYLWVLLITDLVSLGFDFPDWRKWRQGDRAVA